MKFLDTHFEDYLQTNATNNMHTKIDAMIECMPEQLEDFKNLIIYGPPGIGKYSQMLQILSKYSPSELKYEKKICVVFNKQTYFFKISDVHYEIDLSLLGCNSKLLWHEIYMQIVDAISAKPKKVGIIVCKYFNKIHTELLEIFYSYMQYNAKQKIDLKFVLITEELSFIPENILKCCQVIPMARPTKKQYQKTIPKASELLIDSVEIDEITNIKHLQMINCKYDANISNVFKGVCNQIIKDMVNIDDNNFVKFRDAIYDIFIYNLDVSECVWYILSSLVKDGYIKDKFLTDILKKTYEFFLLYNNNYRPIYHIESLLFTIASYIHDLR
jgi:hypothetical protein